MRRLAVIVRTAWFLACLGVSAASAQGLRAVPAPTGTAPGVTQMAPPGAPPHATASDAEGQEPESSGLPVPQSDKLRIGVRFLAGYGADKSQENLGLENQGRVGYAILSLSGRLSDHFSYLFEVNPVHETEPLPSCGEPRYFYPNTPQAFGPNVVCDNNGRLRVDDYRFIALDTVNQAGPIRVAYLEWSSGAGGGSATAAAQPATGSAQTRIAVRFGRFILPIGFWGEDVGSFTAKDATHIQRINAEANFGMMVSARRMRHGRPLVDVHGAAFLGDGNRFHDYDYYYSLDASLDTNSALTALFSGSVYPIPGLDVRGAVKFGYTGSKVEVLPNFFASKRNDKALVFSARYLHRLGALSLGAFGEYGHYVWGPTPTSAEMLNLPTDPIHKNGYYAGAEAAYQAASRVRVGANVTREELSRDDSLVEWLALQGLYGVAMGETERSLVVRVYVEINRMVTIGYYHNSLDNPYPWASGIVPVEGPNAYGEWGRGNNKWGLVVRFVMR